MIPGALPDLLEVVLTLPFSGDGIEANRSMVTEACALPDADREQLAGAVIDLRRREALQEDAGSRALVFRAERAAPEGARSASYSSRSRRSRRPRTRRSAMPRASVRSSGPATRSPRAPGRDSFESAKLTTGEFNEP